MNKILWLPLALALALVLPMAILFILPVIPAAGGLAAFLLCLGGLKIL